MDVTARALMRRMILLAVAVSYSAALVHAQITGGLNETTNTRHGGNNYIAGTVYAPDGFPISTRMRIKLTSPANGDIIVTTDERGQFVFSGVSSGTYTVTIDSEKEYQPVSQQVDIIRERNIVPETYNVTIRLREANAPKSTTKPSVVNAANAGVPKKALEFYDKAAALAREKDYQGAIRELKLAVEEYPSYVSALNLIGMLHMRLNELDKADEAFKAALKIDPEAYEPLLNRSITLFKLSKFKDAEALLRKTLKVKPESAAAYYYLGRTLNKLGKNDEAEKAFLTCTEKSPGEFKEAHRLLAAIYLDRGKPERVVEQLELYLKLVPTAPDANNLRMVIEQNKRAMTRE
jgi:tetratricopeptide (TPR) repeat protein